jgi:tyrosyl-tRNA synthetase
MSSDGQPVPPEVVRERIAYLGPSGTFSEMALSRFESDNKFDGPVKRLPARSQAAALEMVRAGEASGAVVPIESSVDGAVTVTLDALATGSRLQILAEVELPIAFEIAVRPGTALVDINRLASYSIAKKQVQHWLDENLPSVTDYLSDSNAAAAVDVINCRADAAVTTALAREQLGLEALHTGVADRADAFTRFVYVVKPTKAPAPSGIDRTSIWLDLSDEPGALAKKLAEFGSRGLSITFMESRPTHSRFASYRFFVDCVGHIDDPSVAEAMTALHRAGTVHYLGSRPASSATSTPPPSLDWSLRWLTAMKTGADSDTLGAAHIEVNAADVCQAEALARNTVQVLPDGQLVDRIARARAEGRPLRVKLGVDPTASDLTLGHAVVLRKLRQFQDYGHVAILIIGDFTGQIGDPSGIHARKPIRKEQTRAFAKAFLEQSWKILRTDLLEVRLNTEWLEGTKLVDVMRISSGITVAGLLEKDNFARRFKEKKPITVSEFMYPMLQGMDSVAVQADIEIGGTEQTVNILMGRDLQRDAGQVPQLLLTVPLLRGIDGSGRMGQTPGSTVAVNDTPDEQFGKIMSIADDHLDHFAALCCAWDDERLSTFSQLASTHPMQAKIDLAHRIVELYHTPDEADAACKRFDEQFRRKELPSDARQFQLRLSAGETEVDIVKVLRDSDLARSKSDARRLIAADAVSLDGQKLRADQRRFAVLDLEGKALRCGRRSVKLVAQEP